MIPQVPKVQILDISFSVIPTKTRFPFRYGIAAMTEAPHWFIHSEILVDGKPARGVASEGLPPKWFTKNPETTFEEDDLPGMEKVIRKAACFAREIGESASFFDFWLELKARQERWAEEESIPPLLAQLGTALIERTVLDALCRGLPMPLHLVVRENRLGIRLGEIHPELSASEISTAIPDPPLSEVKVRHTIGLADPLTDDDIPQSDRIDDGLPQTLVSNIQAYGLNRFKIKLAGELDADRARLRAIAALFGEEITSGDYALTIDGNEQYHDIDEFRDHFHSHQSDPGLAPLFQRLLFVEQPIHRDHALTDSVRDGLAKWSAAPPVIIDESDASVDCLPQALSLGYSGTSHKNCKGVVKSLANRALLNRVEGGLLSAEDLANLGPVALLQDLAVVALLGIDHVERNGHHYFAGLSMFPREMQEETLAAHPDLYQRGSRGFPTLTIRGGQLSCQSINEAPFGCGCDLATLESSQAYLPTSK